MGKLLTLGSDITTYLVLSKLMLSELNYSIREIKGKEGKGKKAGKDKEANEVFAIAVWD